MSPLVYGHRNVAALGTQYASRVAQSQVRGSERSEIVLNADSGKSTMPPAAPPRITANASPPIARSGRVFVPPARQSRTTTNAVNDPYTSAQIYADCGNPLSTCSANTSPNAAIDMGRLTPA